MKFSIYGGKDPRELPAYSVQTAAFLLNLSPGTLSRWVSPIPRASGISSYSPIVRRPGKTGQLSFLNLIEVHLVAAMRHRHGLPLGTIRKALDYLHERYPESAHPLLDHEFQTDGVGLIIDHFGEKLEISSGGQFALKELIQAHLERVDRDDTGLPIRLFPFVRNPQAAPAVLAKEPKLVVIDPAISFGRPVIAGTGIPTATVAERYKAGEPLQDLAFDYGQSLPQIEEALRYELRLRVA